MSHAPGYYAEVMGTRCRIQNNDVNCVPAAFFETIPVVALKALQNEWRSYWLKKDCAG